MKADIGASAASSTLCSLPPSEAAQHPWRYTKTAHRRRPKAAAHPLVQMLQSQPAFPPFAVSLETVWPNFAKAGKAAARWLHGFPYRFLIYCFQGCLKMFDDLIARGQCRLAIAIDKMLRDDAVWRLDVGREERRGLGVCCVVGQDLAVEVRAEFFRIGFES